jgi:predicted ATPase
MSPAALIGRDAELGALHDVLETLAGGDGGMVAVDGEPGIGKTSVLAELQAQAERRGFTVYRGAASEFERDQPYAVVADALDAAVAADAGLLDGLAPAMLEELAELLPSLRARAGASVAKVTDERFRAHRAFRGLLEELAADAPLVVILDDLHWPDVATTELILALLRRAPGRPALLVSSLTSGAPPRMTP